MTALLQAALTTRYSHFTILVDILANHILVENTNFSIRIASARTQYYALAA